jgi:hypothetical protein
MQPKKETFPNPTKLPLLDNCVCLGPCQDAEGHGSFDPAYAWWTEWFPATVPHHTQHDALQKVQEHQALDEDHLRGLDAEDLHEEVQVRRDALMLAFKDAGNAVAVASARLKRARAEIANRDRQQDNYDKKACDQQDFSSGGFF